MRVPISFMRGGTSKAAVLLESDLPPAGPVRDALLVRLMGGGDPYRRQLDGLGGGSSSTSKIAIVAPGADGADVDFLFGQVGVDRAAVDWSGTCGNISAAIGPFALEHGLVAATDPITAVRVRNRNTGTEFFAHVPTSGGAYDPDGEFAIGGVAGTGSRIRLDFLDPAGAVTGALLPTGAAAETIDGVRVTVLDVANPVVFVAAADVGVTLDGPVTDDPELLDRLERIRRTAAVRAGIAADADAAAELVVPRVALVAADPECTVRAAMVSAGRPHLAYPFTGALATATACRVPGTVVHELARAGTGPVTVRHPGGSTELEIEFDGAALARVSSDRTARTLMTGWAEVPIDHD